MVTNGLERDNKQEAERLKNRADTAPRADTLATHRRHWL